MIRTGLRVRVPAETDSLKPCLSRGETSGGGRGRLVPINTSTERKRGGDNRAKEWKA